MKRRDPARRPGRYALIGHPVEHSFSPQIHAAFALATGQQMVYERLLAPLDAFEATLREFVAAGGLGCNITLPFKFSAFQLCPRRSARAELAGAANVLRFDAEGWLADNSDGVGLLRDIEHNAGFALAGRRVLLIGAGGAAAGVLGPLLQAGPAALLVANRSPDKAAALVARHLALADEHGVVLRSGGLAQAGTAFDLVLNASASSLGGDLPALPASAIGPGALVLDLMYGPAAVPFLAWAAGHGARTRDGLGMLVEQAAEAFLLWRDVRPETATVLAGLRLQVDAAATP